MDTLLQHPYHPPAASDSRSPCPALNTLANHGILPRDGRHISLFQLADAVRRAYHLSTPLAYLLAVGGLLLCSRRWLAAHIDLGDLARHDRIEHDASLVHADAPKGARYAPTAVDPALLSDVLARCPPQGMGLEDLCEVRAARETANARDARLDGLHRTLGAAEAVFLYNTLKDASGGVPRDRLEQWLGEERFPDGWTRPEQEQGFLALHHEANKVKKKVQQLKDAKQKSV
ncbi:heme-thiolate peroxidase [Punctularia strigosozonata HHB-11173 SS5]|uniref:heme-thiolate peroxidase n=1 Tax=Punctularia strigosozonata (strain HHB-11173) TaxID=741275 RepID=UPI0004418277|nr:heme-thiolate peroxidase [Punctularia strigosozonata HHB-11173 SS5]EIN14758.1 heme-thiolate peroxidase [Punctularia strigosozonata HHB-11173 SS5]